MLPDGWEIRHGLDPCEPATPSNTVWNADGDGLGLFDEYRYCTDPGKTDTDGDGVSDSDELTPRAAGGPGLLGAGGQGGPISCPNDASDGGDAANCVTLRLTVGDPSGSHSERWILEVFENETGADIIRHCDEDFGTPGSAEYALVKGKTYRFSLRWIATDPDDAYYPQPDYDWQCLINDSYFTGPQSALYDTGVIVVEDDDGLLTWERHGDSYDITIGCEGKIHVPKVEIVPSEVLGCPRCLDNAAFSLTGNSLAPGGVTWAVTPQIQGGATLTANGESVAFHPGTVGTNYFITAVCVDAPSCVATSKVTVCVPGPITFSGNQYDDVSIPDESHKLIWTKFNPTPNSDVLAEHFVFVQHVKGYMKDPTGGYIQIAMYGQSTLRDINFPDYVIDSGSDNDPAYLSPRPGHYPGSNIGEYVVYDDVSPGDYRVGVKCDLQFRIGIYCEKEVPLSGADTNVSVGSPFDEKPWVFQFTATTNATGEKVFTHP
jgi:hypothetical protein